MKKLLILSLVIFASCKKNELSNEFYKTSNTPPPIKTYIEYRCDSCAVMTDKATYSKNKEYVKIYGFDFELKHLDVRLFGSGKFEVKNYKDGINNAGWSFSVKENKRVYITRYAVSFEKW